MLNLNDLSSLLPDEYKDKQNSKHQDGCDLLSQRLCSFHLDKSSAD